GAQLIEEAVQPKRGDLLLVAERWVQSAASPSTRPDCPGCQERRHEAEPMGFDRTRGVPGLVRWLCFRRRRIGATAGEPSSLSGGRGRQRLAAPRNCRTTPRLTPAVLIRWLIERSTS